MINKGRFVSRFAAIAIVFVMCLSVARAASGVQEMSEDAYVEAASAEYVRVGWMGTIVNWNPLTIQMTEDHVACYLIHSSLFTYDQDWGGPVNDLATGYTQVVNPDGSMTTTITITQNAYFRTAADIGDISHPLTAYDVAFTLNLIKANQGGAFDFYLQDVVDIMAVDTYTVSMCTPYAKATLLDDLAGIPILPEYVWQDVSRPLGSMLPTQLVGSGPFVYESMLKDSWYKFKRADNYHGAADHPGVREVDTGIAGIMYTVYADTIALSLEMNSGAQDAVVLTGDMYAFSEVLGEYNTGVNIIKAAVSENGICDVAINAIPPSLRTASYGNGHPALLDPYVRKAVMMTLDKDYITETLLGGLGTVGDSVVGPGFWQADIENELPYDPVGAKAMLEANGWVDADGDGYLEATHAAYGVQMSWFEAGTELSNIRCQAVDTDPTYGFIAIAWQGWAAQAGIGLTASIESEMTMVNMAWYQADYDIWVWNWAWGPEPLGGTLSTWLTSEITPGGCNCQMPMGPWWAGYWNYSECLYIDQGMIDEFGMDSPDFRGFSAFDQNFSIALKTIDLNERKAIVDKLQQWIYDSYTESPPYYNLGLYAYTDYMFEGWGDWEAHSGLNICSDLLWLWFQLEPVVNRAPVFDVPPSDFYAAYVDVPEMFTFAVSDSEGDDLWLNVSFGDGAAETHYLTGDTTQSTYVYTSHTYVTPAAALQLSVSLTDMFEGRTLYRNATVDVLGEYNSPPVFITPLEPFYEVAVGVPIDFSVTVYDPDGDPLMLNWSFGDGEMTFVEIFNSTEYPTMVVQTHTYQSEAVGLGLWVSVHDFVQGHQVLSESSVDVVGDDQRGVRYQWHGMFEEPFGDWWEHRIYAEIMHDTYPYIYREYTTYGTVGGYYSSMQLEVDADNLPEINMLSDPQFLPFLGTERGGNAVIDWYLQYITYEEAQEWPLVANWYDGWFTRLSGTTALDLTAAKAVMGISDDGLEDFDAWWAANEDAFEYLYDEWLYDESRRLGVYSMYEWPLQIAVEDMNAVRLNDTVVIEYDIISWGMEALMTKWLHEAFMPTEWYFEDFSMHAEISPDSTDIDISTAVAGAVFGWKDISTGQLSWVWRGMLQDVVPTSYNGPSDFDPYEDDIYLNMYAGSTFYGEMIPFDYTPGASDLSDGEEMSFEWPDGLPTFIVNGGEDWLVTADYGMMSPYSEPGTNDLPSNVHVDDGLRTLTLEGPLDMYTWSMEQTAHDYLASEWDRLGMLPYGIPWIEFRAAMEPQEPYMIILENVSYHAIIGEPVGLYVTVADMYGNPCADYRGTLSFYSTDENALLPEDYTFTAYDAGTHYFEVTFATEGDQWVGMFDASNLNLSTGIWFDVRLPYEVDIYEPDDYYAQASVIQLGEMQEHSIVPEWDDDYVTFTLAEPTCVGIRTFINGSGDTVMSLFDEYGVPYYPIAYDDDSGGNLSSLITMELQAGTYWVVVSAFGDYNEIPSYYIWLYETETVNLPPYANMSWWPYEPAPGQEVGFDGGMSYDPDGYIVDWQWDFGDGSTGEGAWINHTFYEVGEYLVTLTVVDNMGATGTAQAWISVHENTPPVAALTYMPENPDPYETVFFDAWGSYDPDGWIEYYVFDFGDGYCEWTWYPETWHTYYTEGVYTVTLTVYDSGWASNSTSVDVRVGGEPAPPVAVIGYLPPLPLVGEPVLFDASYSFDPDGTISTYIWQFGDGCVAEGMTVTHAYEHEGVYEVRLTVVDSDMMVDQDWANLTVASVPVAAIVHTPLVPDIEELVTFYAYGSYDEGGIVEYAWSFGDGTYALGWQVEHTYMERGDYLVTLTVTNMYGIQDSATMVVEVGDIGSGVRGSVVSETLKPLRNAVVDVVLDGMTVASTLTDGNGEFLIRGLTPGVYDLVVSKKGYADVTMSITVGEGVLDVGTIVLTYDRSANTSSAILAPESSLLLVELAAALGVAMLAALLIWKRRK